jgi:hypothetical protein
VQETLQHHGNSLADLPFAKVGKQILRACESARVERMRWSISQDRYSHSQPTPPQLFIIVVFSFSVCYNLCQFGRLELVSSSNTPSPEASTPRRVPFSLSDLPYIQQTISRLRLIQSLLLPLKRSSMLIILILTIFLDSRSDLLSNLIIDSALASLGIRSVEIRPFVSFFAVCVCCCARFAGFALLDLAVETDLLAALVAVPEDEHEDCRRWSVRAGKLCTMGEGREELTENRQTHDYIRSADQEGEADLQEIDDVPEDAGYYAVGAG